MTAEYFKMMAGIEMVHVAYRGAPPALTDLLGGQVHVMFANLPSSIEHIKAGRLRPLAVSAPKRLEALPEVPTVAEFVPGFETSAWAVIGAPRDTPGEIVGKLNGDQCRPGRTGHEDAHRRARRQRLCVVVRRVWQAACADTEKWAKVIKASNAKPD